MKKLFGLLLAGLMLLSFMTACGTENKPLESGEAEEKTQEEQKTDKENDNEQEDSKTEEKTQEEQKQEEKKPDKTNLSPLELLDCYANDKGQTVIPSYEWTSPFTTSDYRKYFFGIWEEYKWEYDGKIQLIVDDSEKSNWYRALGYDRMYYKANNSNTIVCIATGQVEDKIFWVDMDNPDTLYYMSASFNSADYEGADFRKFGYRATDFFSMTKTSQSINQPENGYLSEYKLFDISNNYGIAYDMLTFIEYEFNEPVYGFDNYEMTTLYHDTLYADFSIYLVSESPEKLVFKTKIGDSGMAYVIEPIDIIFTIERINGDWVRTVELDTD